MNIRLGIIVIIALQAGLIQADSSSASSSSASPGPTWTSKKWQNWVASNGNATVQKINTNIGSAAGQAAAIIYDGYQKQQSTAPGQIAFGSLQNLSSILENWQTAKAIQSSAYYDTNLLSTLWIQYFTTWLKSNGATYPFQGIDFGHKTIDPDQYLTNHLIPALQSLQSSMKANVHDVQGNFYASMPPVKGFNAVIIHQINNNTDKTFNIKQNGNTIGTLQPKAKNAVALYGASAASQDGGSGGDILFVPVVGSNTGKSSSSSSLASSISNAVLSPVAVPLAKGTVLPDEGSWRISFQDVSDIMTLANSQVKKYASANDLPAGTSGSYLCVQITSKDFPPGTDPTNEQNLQRTQCINVSKLPCPALIELNIEDSLSPLDGNTVIPIDQKTAKVFYPSIHSVTLLNGLQAPFLLLPESLQQNALVSSWIDLINLIIGATSLDYKLLADPSNITEIIGGAAKLHVLQKSGDDFGSIADPILPVTVNNPKYGNVTFFDKDKGTPLTTMISGMPNTQQTIATDIPDTQNFELYLQLNMGTPQGGKVTVDMKKPMTATALLKQMKATNFAEKFILNKLYTPLGLKQKKVGDNKYTVTGTKGFAKKAVAILQKANPLVVAALHKIPAINLSGQPNATKAFSVKQFLDDIQTQAQGKKPVGIELTSIATLKAKAEGVSASHASSSKNKSGSQSSSSKNKGSHSHASSGTSNKPAHAVALAATE